MARHYTEGSDRNTMTRAEAEQRERIVRIMNRYTRDMEADSYYGRNPGIALDDYEDVADEIRLAFHMVDRDQE